MSPTASFLEALFAKSGRTVAEVAEQIGCSKTSVYYWLSGERVPELTHLYKVCDALNLPMAKPAALAAWAEAKAPEAA